jgi:hypothetical protein
MIESLESRSMMSATLPTASLYVAAGDVSGDVHAESMVGSANGGVWKTTNFANATPPSPTLTHGIIGVLIGL